MSLRIRSREVKFRNGWVSDVSRTEGLDAVRLPQGFWEDYEQPGSWKSVPGRTATATGSNNIGSLYRAEGSDGTVLRLVQDDTAVKILLANGTISTTLKSGLTTGKRISYTVMGDGERDYILCFNGTDTPFKIEIAVRGDESGTITTVDASPAVVLTDTSASFITNKWKKGDLVTNDTDGSTGTVRKVISETKIRHSALTGGSDNNWDTSDAYTVSQVRVTDIGVERLDGSNVGVQANAGGANRVKGIVSYFISEVTGTGTEGALSDAFGEIDCADGSRNDLDFDHADYHDKIIRVYRTYKDGADPFYVRQFTVPSSGAGGHTITDGKPDHRLGDPPYANGNLPPAAITSVVTFFNRVYGLAGNDLYWSDLNQPESWFTGALGNRLTVGYNDGDVGTVLATDTDGILVFKKRHLYKVFGREPREFEIHELAPADQTTATIGTPSIGSIAYTTDAGIVFYFNQGLYSYRNNRIVRIGRDIEDDLQTYITSYGTGSFDESGAWDVNLGYQPQTGRVWATIDQQFTVFYDTKLGRPVGAQRWGYGCYMADDYGSSQTFFAARSKGGVGSHDLTAVYTIDMSTTLAVDQVLLLYPFSSEDVRRNLYLDVRTKNDGSNDDAMDFSFTTDEATVSVAAQAVKDQTTKSVKTTRVYLSGTQGYFGRLQLTADSGTNSTRPIQIYGLTFYFQLMRGGAGNVQSAA